MDCGKPMSTHPSAARVGQAYVPGPTGSQPQPVSSPVATAAKVASTFAPPGLDAAPAAQQVCPRCAQPTPAGLPFCGHCGTLVGRRVSVQIGSGEPPASSGTAVFATGRMHSGPRLALLGEGGTPTQSYTLDRGEAVIGRGEADVRFADDQFMSPLHARFELRNGTLLVRDLGSRNGTWVFIDRPTKLTDFDLLLIGSQLIRFRRLGYPGPHGPEADATRRMGSAVPTVDIAVLEQLRADGSVRDVLHLSPGRSVVVGRETGDWLFPYDTTMSGRHAEVRSEDSEFFVHDADSRNGVAMSVRGERALTKGQRLLVGDQILRVESV
jgi:pSer/pThr/pTyr-binding forkhead associated (FHA) protein